MKMIYDAFNRTVIATLFYELASYPFIRVGDTPVKYRMLEVLFFAVPVFLAMLAYDIIRSKLCKSKSKRRK